MKERERTVEEAFDAAAPEYDAWVRQALPTYEELFSVAVEVIPQPKAVLEQLGNQRLVIGQGCNAVAEITRG